MKILFGVFDWGLGHATRDTPLIKELIKNNEVHIISTGNALKLLKKHGLRDWQTRWYVYVGDYDNTNTILERLNILREWKQAVFLMRDRCDKVQKNKEIARMYSWTASVSAFYSVSYEEYN